MDQFITAHLKIMGMNMYTTSGYLKDVLYSMFGPDPVGLTVAVWNIVGQLDLLLLNQGIKRKF